MNILELLSWLNIDNEAQQVIMRLGIKLGILIFFILLSIILGKSTPIVIRLLLRQFAPKNFTQIHENLILPLGNLFKVAGSLILIRVSLNFVREYPGLFEFLQFFIDLAVIITIACLASRLFRQFILVYGINLINKLGREVDELILVLESVVNIMISFIAVVAFAQSQQINLVGLLASLGLVGLAIANASQKSLEQLFSTVILYLDRPYLPGEYIRLPNGFFGRVESIGLRSTKIRTAAKGTLMIIPNSTMANLDIENVSRGRKVMVLLYLNFDRQLDPQESALVKQVVKESTNDLFGIDPGSTKVTIVENENNLASRARTTFFILGSSENSLQLRKRLLELANKKISQRLKSFNIEFTMEEPTIYIDSLITL